MATKRRARKLEQRPGQITPKAVRLFRMIERLPPCSCEPPPAGQWWGGKECASCDNWWRLHNLLHDALKLTVFDWPAITDDTRRGTMTSMGDLEGEGSYEGDIDAVERRIDLVEAVRNSVAAPVARP
jgi:hypothetical protein